MRPGRRLLALVLPLALTSCLPLPDISGFWDDADDEPTLARIAPPPPDGHFRWADGGARTVAISTPNYDQSSAELRLYTPDHDLAGCGPTAVLVALTSLGLTGDIAWEMTPADGLDQHELAAARLVAEIGQQMGARYSPTETTTWPERSISRVCETYDATARRLWSLGEIDASVAAGWPVVVVLRGPTWGNHAAVVRRADSRVFAGDRERRWFTIATGNSGDQVSGFAADAAGSDRVVYAWAIEPLGGNG